MSQKTKHGFSHALLKVIGNDHIYLYRGRDLVHGRGWFCHIYNYEDGRFLRFGFSKNKFTAVRNALKSN